jgi:hypothetical protein
MNDKPTEAEIVEAMRIAIAIRIPDPDKPDGYTAARAFLEGLVKNFPALIAGRDAHIQNLEAEIDRLEGFWGIPSLSRTVCIVLYVMGLLILLVNYLTTQQ